MRPNDVYSVRQQAIIGTNAVLLSIGPFEQRLKRFESKYDICRGRNGFWKCRQQNYDNLFSEDFWRSRLWNLIILMIFLVSALIKTLQHPAYDLYMHFTSTIYI